MTKMKTMMTEPPEWWRVVPVEEKVVLRFVLGSTRVFQRHPSGRMTRFGRKWERKLTYFVKLQLMEALRKSRPGSRPRTRGGQ